MRLRDPPELFDDNYLLLAYTRFIISSIIQSSKTSETIGKLLRDRVSVKGTEVSACRDVAVAPSGGTSICEISESPDSKYQGDIPPVTDLPGDASDGIMTQFRNLPLG